MLFALENSHALPFTYFQAMTELKYFSLACGGTTVLMGCSIPLGDYYYSKYMEEQKRRSTEQQGDQDVWERAEWSMPMRYLGGVVGFAWAASVLFSIFSAWG